jgi:hypothetical protein
MTLRDDLLNLQKIPLEFYWEPEELEKIKTKIDSLIIRTNPKHPIYTKLKELSKNINNKKIEKANKMIEDITAKMHEIREEKLGELEAELQTTQVPKLQKVEPYSRKRGVWKKALVFGLTIASFGLYQPANAAAPKGVGAYNGNSAITKNGELVTFAPGAAIGFDNKGNPYINPSQGHLIQQNNTPPTTYSSEYQRLKQEINGLVQNGASKEVVRRKAEIAKEILDKRELSKIYNGLGNILQEQKNRLEALFYYKEAANLGPEYKESYKDIIQILEKETRK